MSFAKKTIIHNINLIHFNNAEINTNTNNNYTTATTNSNAITIISGSRSRSMIIISRIIYFPVLGICSEYSSVSC